VPNGSGLGAVAKNKILNLSKKLTVYSTVAITGFAKGNLTLAKRRATVLSQYLTNQLHVKVKFYWNTKSTLNAAQIATVSQ